MDNGLPGIRCVVENKEFVKCDLVLIKQVFKEIEQSLSIRKIEKIIEYKKNDMYIYLINFGQQNPRNKNIIN